MEKRGGRGENPEASRGAFCETAPWTLLLAQLVRDERVRLGAAVERIHVVGHHPLERELGVRLVVSTA